ncbi:MAG: response regulator [Chloroflexota bacterium]
MEYNEFRKQTKDALEHLYDPAYLQVHPLLHQFSSVKASAQATRAQSLRGLLKDAIETLRPLQTIPPNAPEWRSYLALRCRYVQGMSLAQIEMELGISLRQLQRELRKGLDALSDILWGMSEGHESRARMDAAGLAGFALAEKDETRKQPQPSPDADLLQEFENELNQWQFTRQPLSIATLLEDALWMLKPLLEQRSVHVNALLPEDLPTVLTDATLTRQVLYKLIQRMTVASPQTLDILVAFSGERVEIDLQAAYCQILVVEEEWQIIQLLANQLGSQLHLEQSDGQLCRVVLGLPVDRQKRVLVVDDNPSIHQLFERYLALHRYEVLHAHNAADALRLAAKAQPDAITLDVMMPQTDGWQILRQLFQNPSTASIPVIVCSVLQEPEIALSLGAKAYLKKPVSRLDLLEILNQILDTAPPLTVPPTTPEDSQASR